MDKKYKFILTLPNDIEVDSAEEIEGHVSWPNYSQAEPIRYRGIFDSCEEAKEYASNFNLYKYILNEQGYDSFESEDEPLYYISIFDAEDAVCAWLGITPGDPYCENPDSYIVEETEADGNKVYKYLLFRADECVLDSSDEEEYFDSYEDAEESAQWAKENFDVELGGLGEYYSLEPIEILDIRIEEIEN